MNRGHNREVVFQDDDDPGDFLDRIDRHRQRFSVQVYHSCLLSNPFHFLIRCESSMAWSTCLAGRLVSDVHAPSATASWATGGQGRLQSPVVALEEDFLSCARSMERNPLAAGMRAEPWQYRCSSAWAYGRGELDKLLSYHVWYRASANCWQGWIRIIAGASAWFGIPGCRPLRGSGAPV